MTPFSMMNLAVVMMAKQEESPTKDKKSNLGAQILMVLAASVVGRSIGGRQFLEVSVTRPE